MVKAESRSADGGSVVIRGGTVYDGDGGPGIEADLLVQDGRVAAIGRKLHAPPGTTEVDAHGCWVTPGFIDVHTHYDAELEVAPALTESVRHGVTTTLVGSCGISMAVGDPEDLADMFCRVEGIPRSHVLPLLERVVDWTDPAGYLDHLQQLPLGPNVVAMLGHSTIRAHVLGLERSTDASVVPSASELDRLIGLIDHSMDAGYLGLSLNALPLDRMDGTRVRSAPTPSVLARFGEYRTLADAVRRHDAVLQAVPDVARPWILPALMSLSTGWRRAPLRTTLLTLVQTPIAPGLHRAIGGLAQSLNRLGNARIRMQALPCRFVLYIDGIDAPVFEELPAGTEALHLEDLEARSELLRDPSHRKRFVEQWHKKLGHAFHRDLGRSEIVSCPDASVVGRSFAELAAERDVEAVDVLLDLAAEWGRDLRWRTVVANDDDKAVAWIMSHPTALIGFSDAGAHLRNMAFYNFGLAMLKRVRDAQVEGHEIMSVSRAVHALTADLADYFGIDAGRLTLGSRADVAIIDPTGLDHQVEEHAEEEMTCFEGVVRLVCRNDEAVRAVLVNGRLAWDGYEAAPDLGRSTGYGQLLLRQR